MTKVRKLHVRKALKLLDNNDWNGLRAFLDEFKGSYAAKLMLEVLIDRGNLWPAPGILGHLN